MRRLARLRHVAGIPSSLVLAAATTFYLAVNATTESSWVVARWLGLWGDVALAAMVTVWLFIRWQRRFAHALTPATLDHEDTTKLGRRRGAVILVGLDSAVPGTTFVRLLSGADRLEYLALVATPQTETSGVVATLLTRLLPLTGRQLDGANVRVWAHNGAEQMGDVEQSVTEALAWMVRHGLHPSEIVVDVTKGRRPMGFGALIAADRANVEVQYLSAEWHHLDDVPMTGTEGFRVVLERWDRVGKDADTLET